MGVELKHISCLSVRRNILGVPSLCNLLLQKFSFLFVHTLPYDCSHIEDVQLLFCARLMIFFSFLKGVELRHFFAPEMFRGCLVCVICNSNRIHSFIFKLCIMIVHKLKMCPFYFMHISQIFFFIFGGLVLRHFFIRNAWMVLVCLICNLSSFYSFIIKLRIMIEHVHPSLCSFDNIFWSVQL